MNQERTVAVEALCWEWVMLLYEGVAVGVGGVVSGAQMSWKMEDLRDE